MGKGKTATLIVFVLLAFGFYYLYTATIVYYDTYAYEITPTDQVELNVTIPLTDEDLAAYPELEAKLQEAAQSGHSMMIFGIGNATDQYEELVEARGFITPYHIFLKTDTQAYAVNITIYGEMHDEPILLILSGVCGLAAVGLALGETVRYYRKRTHS